MEKLVKTDANHTVELDDIEPPPHYHPETGPQVVTADTARSGPLGRRVYVVLVVSLLAVVVGFLLVAWLAR